MNLVSWLYTMSSWLKSLFRRRSADQELDDEIATHLELMTDENVAKGMTPEQARRAAKLELGGVEQVKESVRAVRVGAWIDTFLQDVLFGLRMLRKNPGFTAVAVLTLALGIGANTAIFSVVEGVLLAPLPYRQPDRLVTVWENNSRVPIDSISYPNFRDWQRHSTSFKQMAAVVSWSYDLSGPGTPEHLDGREVTAGFFSTLGIKFELGRDFVPAEDTRGGAPVAIISNALWRERFGRIQNVLGKTLAMNGVSYAVVGVLPPGFYFWSRSDVYTPLGQGDPLMLNARGGHPGIDCIARLNQGVNVGQAQAEMHRIQTNLDRLYPEADHGTGTTVMPLKQWWFEAGWFGNMSRTLLLLLGAVGLLLLIAGSNFANLLLARSAARAREFAIRSALGASRLRLARQLITESVLVSLAGGALGVLAAFWGVRPMLATMPEDLPRSQNIAVNSAVLLFTLAISITIGVVFGVAPALKHRNSDLQTPLQEGSPGSTRSHPMQGVLVIVQTALTLVLLAGAGLLFRTIRNLWDVNPGFDAQHALTFKVVVSSSLVKSPSSTRAAYRQLLETFRNIPGVEAADFTDLVPLTPHSNGAPFFIDDNKPASLQNAPRVLMFDIGTDYLRTMGIPLLRGRFFTTEDTAKSPCVMVIDSVFARMYFPHSNPLDHTLTVGFEPFGPCRIIGVVGHVKHWGLGTTNQFTQNEAYFSLYEDPDKWTKGDYAVTTMVVRTPLDMSSVMPAIRAAADEDGLNQPVYDVQPMQQIVSESMSSERFPMTLLIAFAALALILASVGMYGVISYSVTERVREIGIRMALGAQQQDILRGVLGQGARITLTGIAIGVAASFGLTRLIATMLFGVSATDPLTFAAVVALLFAVALLACWIPARRAMRVDPMVALRHE
ncbi:MAG: ABC transporter permease [Candidatus Acidiferrales bacterium]